MFRDNLQSLDVIKAIPLHNRLFDSSTGIYVQLLTNTLRCTPNPGKSRMDKLKYLLGRHTRKRRNAAT